MTATKILFAAGICLLFSSCATLQRTDLFFGTDIPGGGHVSPEQWKSFSDTAIATRFPEGYTEWDANGRWLDKDTRQTITEHTKVVTFIGKKGKTRNEAIQTIMQTYIRLYKQQAIMRLDMRTRAKFVAAE